jgi:hypothetical protein
MRVVEAFEDLDFAVEVLLKLLVELGEVDRFDGYKSSVGLQTWGSAQLHSWN